MDTPTRSESLDSLPRRWTRLAGDDTGGLTLLPEINSSCVYSHNPREHIPSAIGLGKTHEKDRALRFCGAQPGGIRRERFCGVPMDLCKRTPGAIVR